MNQIGLRSGWLLKDIRLDTERLEPPQRGNGMSIAFFIGAVLINFGLIWGADTIAAAIRELARTRGKE